MPRIKIDKELYNKAKQVAEAAGYSSLEEFITTILEREIESTEGRDNDEVIIKRMKGLGYIS
ncbi:MAG: hypothetical protein GTN76_16620 [Candidatus Aenigmarchaeota archaeon]|nr:hypothetical protein [Candidatus Aenigmarchaeota archaeon]